MHAFFLYGSIAAVIIVITYLRHKERMEMIQRGTNSHAFIKIPKIKTGSSSLFLGLLGLFLGLAMIISAVLIQRRFDPDLMTAGLLFTFGGGAILIYWKLTAKDREHAKKLYKEHLASLNNMREAQETTVDDFDVQGTDTPKTEAFGPTGET